MRLSELEAVKVRLGLGIERDLSFEAAGPISAYIDAAIEAGRIVETLPATNASLTTLEA